MLKMLKKMVKISELWNVDSIYGRLEYKVLAALGLNYGINNLEIVTKANELCNKYSLNTILMGLVSAGLTLD